MSTSEGPGPARAPAGHDRARAAFPALERSAYLNAGTFGPLSRATVDAVGAELRHDLELGRHGSGWFERVLGLREQVRSLLGELVRARPEQVALTTSTTDGCAIVTAGLGLEPGDEVVTTTDEHPGLALPLGATGARVVVVPPDAERIVAAVTPRTKLVAVSQVLWTTGAVLPVRELREATGVPILVDGAQSVGAIPVDAAGIDFLTISGQKWLCGPDTTGALVVADPERLPVARPSYLSKDPSEPWAPDGTYVPRRGAARFDPHWLSAGALAGLRVALEAPPPWRFEWAATMAARCRELLATRFDVARGGATLVSFRPGDDEPEDVVARLERRSVSVRDIPGTGLVRVSCGYWTNDGDLERLLEAL